MIKMFQTLASVMAISGVMAISSVAGANGVQVVVQYSQAQIFDPGFAQIKSEFEAANPGISISYRGPQKDYDATIQALLRESITGEMPDVAYLGLNSFGVAADRGLAIDLAPLMAADKSTFEAGGWSASLQGIGQVGGKQVALPIALSMPVVYFNADLVKQAGGDPNNIPRDWNGLLELAAKIAALGNDVGGIYQSWSTLNGPWLFQGMVYGAGGEIMEPGTRTVAFGGKDGLMALTLYQRMVDEGHMPVINEQAARQQFFAGKIGLFLDSVSRLKSYESAIGDRFGFKTALYPTPDGKPAGLVTGGAVGIITTATDRDPKVKEAAWKFLKYASGPEGTTAIIKTVGYTPVNTLALDDPALLKGYFDDKPRHMTAIEQLPQLREWYQFPGQNGVKINEVMSEYLQAVVDKSMSPQAALDEMVSQVNELLEQ
ncbi:multiple sugar transport system substrate-binding protein [Rhodoligotrophos appendicifer]|uniref:ABC transporter substrate-binding protein n=1 Tax=Rhodoligotrophos appendicifer TaxID=987056 RepID=UPI0011808708|nr:ABC transporter substrate-binding protein [Rhodoligotrophos appendicifer]